MTHQIDDTLTLDPPGRVAVVGAGPLGIEAALYGRFLGYDVTLFEADQVATSLQKDREQPLPMTPDRCLSPLAISALEAQAPESTQVLPTTVGEWVDRALVPLTETDLLRGRLRAPARVVSIETVAVEPERDTEPSAEGDEGQQGEGEQDVPPDFRLHLTAERGQAEFSDTEAVIITTRAADQIALSFELPAPYFFRISTDPPADASADAEQKLHQGWRDIVAVFAQLAGRDELDLYRPRGA